MMEDTPPLSPFSLFFDPQPTTQKEITWIHSVLFFSSFFLEFFFTLARHARRQLHVWYELPFYAALYGASGSSILKLPPFAPCHSFPSPWTWPHKFTPCSGTYPGFGKSPREFYSRFALHADFFEPFKPLFPVKHLFATAHILVRSDLPFP